MKLRFFDFEVTPNWWLCVFGDEPDDYNNLTCRIKNNFTIVSSDDEDARNKLLSLMQEKDIVVCGYNIKGYDLIIANAIYQGLTPREICIISNMIINPSLIYSTKEHMRLSVFLKKKLNNVVYQDLLDDGDGSLKEKECILGLNVLESSVDFNKEDLTAQEKEDMTYYCKQDVFAAMQFYNKVVKSYTNVKLAIGKKFNIPEEECRKSTNAKLVSKVLGAKRTSFLDSEKIEISLPAKIQQYCYDNIPSKVLERLMTDNTAFEINLFHNTVSYGNGGIHSVLCKDLYMESNEDYVLINVDAASYYPSMLIQFKCLSRAVENPQRFIDIFEERIRLKHKKDKTQEDEDAQLANKLVLNTTFGASGNKYLDLYDPYMCTKCCRLGQIFLTALACKISHNIPDLRIVQTNTDGILVYVRRKDLDKLRMYEKEWSEISGINMEEDIVEKIWQRDVNNYLLVKEGGKVKHKGLWLLDDWANPGHVRISPLAAYVSQKAAIQYLLAGKDVINSIVENKNLSDFIITCKKGPTFKGVIQIMRDGTEIPLFKCNRIYATKDKKYGQIYKYKNVNKKGYDAPVRSLTVMSSIPEHCKLINEDLDTYNFSDVQKDLDYIYYINKAIDLLDIDWCTYKNGILINLDNKFRYSI